MLGLEIHLSGREHKTKNQVTKCKHIICSNIQTPQTLNEGKFADLLVCNWAAVQHEQRTLFFVLIFIFHWFTIIWHFKGLDLYLHVDDYRCPTTYQSYKRKKEKERS